MNVPPDDATKSPHQWTPRTWWQWALAAAFPVVLAAILGLVISSVQGDEEVATNTSPTTQTTSTETTDTTEMTETAPIEAFIQLEPTSLDFGSVAADMPDSVTKEVKLANTGLGSLTIMGITSSDGQFSVTSGCPSTLAAGESCSFSVKFIPGTVGHQSTTITIDANGGGQHTLVGAGEGVVG